MKPEGTVETTESKATKQKKTKAPSKRFLVLREGDDMKVVAPGKTVTELRAVAMTSPVGQYAIITVLEKFEVAQQTMTSIVPIKK